MNYCNLIIFKTFTQLSCETWFWFTMIHDIFFAPNRDPSDLPHNSYSGTPSRLLSPPNSMSPSLSGLPVFLWRFWWSFCWLFLEDFFKDKTNLHQKSIPTNLGGVKKRSRFPKLLNFKMGGGPFPKGDEIQTSVISKGDAIPAVFFWGYFLIAWVCDRNVNCINPLDCQWSKHGFGTDSAGKMPARQKLVPMSSKSWGR